MLADEPPCTLFVAAMILSCIAGGAGTRQYPCIQQATISFSRGERII